MSVNNYTKSGNLVRIDEKNIFHCQFISFSKKATIYALFSGNIENFVNLAGVKEMTNSASADDLNKIEA